MFSIPAETYAGEWSELQVDLVEKHPSLMAIKTDETSGLEIGIVVGPTEDLWAIESEYVNPVNYPEYRAAFERRLKPYKMKT